VDPDALKDGELLVSCNIGLGVGIANAVRTRALSFRRPAQPEQALHAEFKQVMNRLKALEIAIL
jgi:hypothetical protein